MNIFYLDEDPAAAAMFHHDVHVRKMIVETAQMLSTIIAIKTPEYHSPLCEMGMLYRKTHQNHPCTIWAGESMDNFMWTFNLLKGLVNEFHTRFNKTHATERVIEHIDGWLSSPITKFKFIRNRFTQPRMAMPDQYKSFSTLDSYREYYRKEKQYDKNGKFMGKYTNTDKPYWI